MASGATPRSDGAAVSFPAQVLPSIRPPPMGTCIDSGSSSSATHATFPLSGLPAST